MPVQSALSPGGEQIPIPCTRCGAPMKEDGPAALVGPVQVRCPYCNAVETLPHEQAQRVVAMRARLAALRAAQQAEEGPSLAYAKIIQTLRSQIWIYVGILALIIGQTIFGAIGDIQKAITSTNLPASVRAEILSSGTTSPAIGIGIFVGVMVGYVLALLKYKKAVEPTLRARAPMQPGWPARCRSCGGPLPVGPVTGAFVACPHCAAQNLMSKELMQNRAQFLDEETRSYSARAAGVQAKAASAIPAFQTYFYIGAGVGVAFALVFGFAIKFVISTIYF